MKSKKSISIKEIAKLSGVSVATVSRVLNNNGRFSEETRKKVMDIVNKFNYQTNMVAKSLRTSKSNIIGVIVPDITNEFFAGLVLAIESYCFPKGYSVFVCNTNEDETKENAYFTDLASKGVDGLIYISGKSDKISKDSDFYNTPIVCIDRKPNISNDVICITSDNYKGGLMATETLIQKGCKNILILRDYRRLSSGNMRYLGYKHALEKHDIKFKEELIIDVKVSFDSAKNAVIDLIKKGIKFDSIFACTDWLAMGAIAALKENNINIPDEIKIIGFDNISIAKYSHPKISTIEQNKNEMGKTAAKVLLDIIEDRTKKIDDLVLPVNLILRETT
ncbi:LacI family transcriptional regulator [Clostridium tetanomorphum]|uniref:LacI family transcriptional regulator n=1 Tax=Clostridium tetanomorphum TaxID=1553 RepID=A0A923J235_CLOTT|nr:LacI family DNA-binding transcriptional regulator [Clostridium tetanomorphum]KAJ50534.1 LacI family transcriptional regulator [Clostridium tetanomorphum DSM 665]MBC2399866.1 LacI family transcriptional regulator [Clostridium tetanomorphum]MBP1866339.1 LacI family transcriptional regulator [Clostridium tetanomorphum]NRS83233.1 LacI family transcriptional regulator [Clostridium tetanomorphum]NRZ98667.1 LacI family transcriptional regulator [Clostridium tetanomorphum]